MKTSLLIVSHITAVLLGLLLFRSAGPAEQRAEESSQTTKRQTHEIVARESLPISIRTKARIGQTSKTGIHYAAWKSLAFEGLTRPERMKASRLLLQQWIKEDWRAALDMVMDETPDDFGLLDEFLPVFSREPEEVWQMIELKRYGVLSQSLVGRWQSALLRFDEATVRKLAESLPERGRQAALETLSWAKSNEAILRR